MALDYHAWDKIYSQVKNNLERSIFIIADACEVIRKIRESRQQSRELRQQSLELRCAMREQNGKGQWLH